MQNIYCFYHERTLAHLLPFWISTYLNVIFHWSMQEVKCAKWMVFCYQNYSDSLWEEIVLVIEKNIWNSRQKAENLQTTIHSNSVRSFFETECFLNLLFIISNALEQLEVRKSRLSSLFQFQSNKLLHSILLL